MTKALDGVFHTLGEEEWEIRTNPAARVTDLQKEVFGKKRSLGDALFPIFPKRGLNQK